MDQRETDTPLRGNGSSSREVRHDIAQTRDRMDETLDRLAERLQHRHILDEVIGWFRSRPQETRTAARNKATNMGKNVMHWIEDHPVPLMLLGGAIAAYIYDCRRRQTQDASDYEYDYERGDEWAGEEAQVSMGGTSVPAPGWPGEKPETGYSDVESEAQGRIQGLTEAAKARARAARERAGEIGTRARGAVSRARTRAMERGRALRERGMERAEELRGRARDAWSSGRDQISGVMEEKPLVMGLGFLALGVLSGMILPRTHAEQEWLGETSSQLKQRGKDLARDAMQRGKSALSAAGQAAAEEAERQGLTAETIAEKARVVAKTATEASADAVRSTTPAAG
jgi:hypothetical protein